MKTESTPTLAAVAKPRLVRFSRSVWESHRFFLRESFPYSGTAFIKHPLQWIRAYSRFMFFSVKDAIREANSREMPPR